GRRELPEAHARPLDGGTRPRLEAGDYDQVAADGAHVLNPGPLLGAALVAAAVMLTACGSTSVSPKFVADAATKTSSLRSYRVQTTTTHYKGAVDLRKVADKAPAKLRAELRTNVDRLIALTGSSTIPVEVWVDEHGYVRKERYTEKLELQGHKVDVEESVELFDFGTPVIAPVPPAADVSDFTAATTGSSS